jgi:hypothetical protein
MVGFADLHEMWPDNTADVTTLLPVIDRLCQSFGIGQREGQGSWRYTQPLLEIGHANGFV